MAGNERTCTSVAGLIDTNILVYRFDPRFPAKQEIATALLRRGIDENSLRLAHQAVIEFVAATTRPLRGGPILSRAEALREAEELLNQFEVLYPNEAILRLALRGCAAYQLNWFDAHMWAYAEFHGLRELFTEDLEHGRVYGSVRVVDPFLRLIKA